MKLIKEGKMTQVGLLSFKGARKRVKARVSKQSTLPRDVKEALTKNEKAYENFKRFAPSYRREYIHWIKSAKKAETRERRIREVVTRSFKSKKPGMM